MAREHARVLTRIWNDKDFIARSAASQRVYLLMMSQSSVSHAGVLPLQLSKWARKAADTTVEDIQAGLEEMVAERFLVVDYDTEEVLIRTHIRNDGVLKQPNMLKSALRQARAIESPKLRAALADELRRIGLESTVAVAEEIDPNPSGTPPEPIPNPSGTHRDVNRPAVDNYSERKASRAPREPIPDGSGEGEGEGESFSSVGGQVGGSRASARKEPPAPEPPDPNGPRPPERCERHLGATDDPPCRACRTARLTAERWDADQHRAEAERRRKCRWCTSDGYRKQPGTRAIPLTPLVRCDHTADQLERLEAS